MRVLALIYGHALGLKLAGGPFTATAAARDMTVRLARRIVSLLLRRITVGSLIVVEGDGGACSARGARRDRLDRVRRGRWPELLRGSRGLAEAYAEASGTHPTSWR